MNARIFAGIRTEELCREKKGDKRPLDWSDIDFGTMINVPAEALTNWLTPFRKAKGPFLPCPAEIDPAKFDFASVKSNIIEELSRTRIKAELEPVDFQKNDFRHTFASNCVVFHQSFASAQLCLGHANSRTIKRYRIHRNKEAAVIYFGSKPTRVPRQPDCDDSMTHTRMKTMNASITLRTPLSMCL